MTEHITVPRELLRQVIESLEETCGHRCNAEYNPCNEQELVWQLRTALEQPVQEPVAEMSHKYGRPVLLPGAPMLADKQPLYTAPQAQQPLCPCKDRPADQCDEEWGPNCDLGNNEAHCKPAPEINQCDGCRSGQEMRGALHIDRHGKPTMVCQAGKYPQKGGFKRPETGCLDVQPCTECANYKRMYIDVCCELVELRHSLKAPRPHSEAVASDLVVESPSVSKGDAYYLMRDAMYAQQQPQLLTEQELRRIRKAKHGHDEFARAIEIEVLRKNGVIT